MRKLLRKLGFKPAWTTREVDRVVDGYEEYLMREGRWTAKRAREYRANMEWALLGVGSDPMMKG